MESSIDRECMANSSQQCTFCSKVIHETEKTSVIYLSCNNHFICSKVCANEFAIICTENNILNWESTQCFICSIPLSKDFYRSIYGEYFEEIVKKAYDEIVPDFTCAICYKIYKITDSIILQCNHKYCRNCLKIYLEYKINEAKVSKEDLACPECNLFIHISYLKEIVDSEIFIKYEFFSMEKWTPKLQYGEFFYCCNGVDCNYKAILSKRAEEFECPRCRKKCCPKCKEEVHKSLTCEESIKKKKDALDEEIFNNSLKSSGYIRCPWCGNGIEKITGCNFVTCLSSQCRGQKYLCFDCRNGLSQDHQQHNCIRTN
ncbi:hypothetical protein SteCoe_12568 [Stentor coeruleus]|uniref:RBR-type E3 ubiquitin transferase n=1 Tax=Stentor coeruleus TaxID=5963 RepID=A0A1R2CAK8_9CILI|nr:hypothetical protein SteCoe_12568 [Stentor coeruleus]